jgi:glutamate/tyrosine decarboxylase-like PLP-dependent enzyme
MSDQTSAAVFSGIVPYPQRFPSNPHVPEKGAIKRKYLEELLAMSGEENQKWETGQCSGTMYHGGKSHYAFLSRVFSLFSFVNLLQRDLCPSGTKFEAEIVSMTAKMLNGDVARQLNDQDEVCGVVTSGGSESIFNGVYVHREWAREEKGITQPEMVVPTTIHPAFYKAAHYLGIKIVDVPVKENFEADVEAMRKASPRELLFGADRSCDPYGFLTC